MFRPQTKKENPKSALSLSRASMEFKFRAVDDRPPPYPSPPSTFNHFDQPLPMPGQVIPQLPNFTPLPLPNGPSGFPVGVSGPNSGVMWDPRDFRGYMGPEFEKDRFSEEMILGEIARRRELEAMVRQEIVLLEREMAVRRAAMGTMPFEDGFPAAMQFTSAPFAVPPHATSFDPLQLAPPPGDIAPVFNPPSEPNKDKLIVLAKPEPSLSGAKRKAPNPPTLDANELHPFGLKKKPKEELSCALCQVSATGETDLNNHLQGKKHKRREAALRNQKMGKSPSHAPRPKKTRVSSELKETNNPANSNSKEKSFKQNGPQNGSNKKKVEDAEDSKPKNEVLLQKDENAGELNMTSGSEIVQKLDRSVEHKINKKTGKKFRFWCEMCLVGSSSSKVMEQHKKGKKHSARLVVCEPQRSDEATLKITETSEPVPEDPEDPHFANQASGKTTHNMANMEIVPRKPEDADVANEANGNTTDNMATTEAVRVKQEDSDVANEANGKTTNDVVNPDIVPEKPEDTDVANRANEKATDNMANTEAVHVKQEEPDVANEANGKTTDDMEVQISRIQLQRLQRLQRLTSVDGRN